MSAQDTAIAKLQRLPEPLAQEVADFIDVVQVDLNPVVGSEQADVRTGEGR